MLDLYLRNTLFRKGFLISKVNLYLRNMLFIKGILISKINLYRRNALLRKGILASKITADSQVQGVLRKLAPQITDKSLIRIGAQEDGGYLIPDDLQGIEYCFSPGVAATATFESDLAERGISSFLADYSVDGPPITSTMLKFEKKYLGAVNDDRFMTLESWVNKTVPNHKHDLILQMDIEGSEYEVILETPNHIWNMFRIVVIEFHGLHNIFNPYGIKLLDYCFTKMLTVFDVVHIHPNNVSALLKRKGLAIPDAVEITFLRRDRIRWREANLVFPHPLDRPNVAIIPDVVLPSCWYR